MQDKKAKALGEAIKKAEARLLQHLRKTYPFGSQVGVLLSSGQLNPSAGTVVWHRPTEYGGEVGVRLDKCKKWSRQMTRGITVDHVTQVYHIPANEEEAKANVELATNKQMGV